MAPLFLTPYFRFKLWGGRKLATIFHYHIPKGKVGEAWIISGYKDDASTVSQGPFAGQPLRTVYLAHPELFGYPKSAEFPLLVKFLDANANLSVQVHPDDAYAHEVEHDRGKTESWYVLQADPGAYLIYGHNAKTKTELTAMVKAGDWDHLLRKVPVKAGDFFYVPAGTIHALTKGILVIETQQSSDVTYRLYDYDRVDDATGQKRLLHTQKSLDVTRVPHVDAKLAHPVVQETGGTITTLAAPPQSVHFYLWEVQVAGAWQTGLRTHPYLLVSVIAGTGELVLAGKVYPLAIGTNLIVPNGAESFIFKGQLKLIMSAPGPQE